MFPERGLVRATLPRLGGALQSVAWPPACDPRHRTFRSSLRGLAAFCAGVSAGSAVVGPLDQLDHEAVGVVDVGDPDVLPAPLVVVEQHRGRAAREAVVAQAPQRRVEVVDGERDVSRRRRRWAVAAGRGRPAPRTRAGRQPRRRRARGRRNAGARPAGRGAPRCVRRSRRHARGRSGPGRRGRSSASARATRTSPRCGRPRGRPLRCRRAAPAQCRARGTSSSRSRRRMTSERSPDTSTVAGRGSALKFVAMLS